MQGFVERIITRLAEADVEFIIVGGLSAVLHGIPIVTQDLDVCYRRTEQNMSRLAGALLPLKPRLRGLPEGVPNVFDVRSLQIGLNFTLEMKRQADSE